MVSKKTLNVGCGNRTYTEYPSGYKCTNMDFRGDLKEVDLVGDVTNLDMFPNDKFDYVLASDIIEHFPISRTADILKEWYRVLKTGGVLELRTPNLKWAAEHYVNYRDAKFASYHIFGGQDYEGNFHHVMFDQHWLTKLCVGEGFKPLTYEEEGSNFILKVSKL